MDYPDSPASVVQRYVEAFNRGDAQGLADCFGADAAILDGMAPHLWLGPTATSDWYRDVLVEKEHLGGGDFHVSLDEPTHDVVTGDSAYFVAPARMTFEQNGRKIEQSGATFTFALKREASGWKIVAWAWAKGKAK